MRDPFKADGSVPTEQRPSQNIIGDPDLDSDGVPETEYDAQSVNPALEMKKNVSVGLANFGADGDMNTMSNETSFRKGLTELFKGEANKETSSRLETRQPLDLDGLSN